MNSTRPTCRAVSSAASLRPAAGVHGCDRYRRSSSGRIPWGEAHHDAYRRLHRRTTGLGATLAPWCMCGRPPGCKRKKMRILTGGSIAIMCPICWRGSTGRWPRWGPRSKPNTNAALKACAPNGFSGSSVRPIVISFSSFTPASTRVLAVLTIAAPPLRASSRPMPSGPSRCSIPPKLRGGSIAGSLTKIELTYRLQHVGYSAVAQVRRQGCQPSGILGLKAYECADGVVPMARLRYAGWTTDADRRFACCAPRGGRPGVRHPSWASRRLIDGGMGSTEAIRHETGQADTAATGGCR